MDQETAVIWAARKRRLSRARVNEGVAAFDEHGYRRCLKPDCGYVAGQTHSKRGLDTQYYCCSYIDRFSFKALINDPLAVRACHVIDHGTVGGGRGTSWWESTESKAACDFCMIQYT